MSNPLVSQSATLEPSERTAVGRIAWRVAVGVWAVIFVVTCLRPLASKHVAHTVFPVFTTAAESWRHGRSLYERAGDEEFRYSPLVAAFFVPLGRFPRIGETLWRSINFFALFGGLIYSTRVGLAGKPSAGRAAAVLLLAIPLVTGSLSNAQSNPLVLGMILIASAGALQKRWWLAAACVGVATLFKLYPLAAGLLLIVIYPRQLSWRTAVALAIGLALPLLLQRTTYVLNQYQQWYRYLASEDRQGMPIDYWYHDVRALSRLFVGRMNRDVYAGIEVAAGALLAGVLILARWRKWPAIDRVRFAAAAGCAWMTSLGPATESATFTLVGGAVAWTVVRCAGRSLPWRVSADIALGLLVLSQFVHIFPHGKWARTHLQPQAIGGLWLMLVLLADAARDLIRRSP